MASSTTPMEGIETAHGGAQEKKTRTGLSMQEKNVETEMDICVNEALQRLLSAAQTMGQVPSEVKPIYASGMNMLVQPYTSRPPCPVCGWPGHKSEDIQHKGQCHTAILTTIYFWDAVGEDIRLLDKNHPRFKEAVDLNKATKEMVFGHPKPLFPSTTEQTIVFRLTINYLKFQHFFSKLGSKAKQILSARHIEIYEDVTENLNDYLLDGQTCTFSFPDSDLFGVGADGFLDAKIIGS